MKSRVRESFARRSFVPVALTFVKPLSMIIVLPHMSVEWKEVGRKVLKDQAKATTIAMHRRREFSSIYGLLKVIWQHGI